MDNTALSFCDDNLYDCNWSPARKRGQLVHPRKMTYRTQNVDVMLSPRDTRSYFFSVLSWVNFFDHDLSACLREARHSFSERLHPTESFPSIHPFSPSPWLYTSRPTLPSNPVLFSQIVTEGQKPHDQTLHLSPLPEFFRNGNKTKGVPVSDNSVVETRAIMV